MRSRAALIRSRRPRRAVGANRGATLAAIVAAAAFLTILSFPIPARCFPWSTDMFRSPAIEPLTRTPRNQPAGTLSESEIEPLSPQAAGKKRHNPFRATPTVLKKGQALFETYCTPCHGNDGRGFGPVRYLLRVPPADLTHGMPVAIPDGTIYSTIRNGNHAMPPYGDTMSSNGTWAVVLYVRELQRRANESASSR